MTVDLSGGGVVQPQNFKGAIEIKGGDKPPQEKPGNGPPYNNPNIGVPGTYNPPANDDPNKGVGNGNLKPETPPDVKTPPIIQPPFQDDTQIDPEVTPLPSPPPQSIKYNPPLPLTSPPPGNISMGAAIFLSCLPSLVIFVQLFNFANAQHEIKEENREIILNEIKQAFVEMEAESEAIERSFDARMEQTKKQANSEFIAAGQSASQAVSGGISLGMAYRARNAEVNKGKQDLERMNAPEHTDLQTAKQNMAKRRADFAEANPDDETVQAANANYSLKDQELKTAKQKTSQKAKQLESEQRTLQEMEKALKEDMAKPQAEQKGLMSRENDALFKAQLEKRDIAKKDYALAQKDEGKAQVELNKAEAQRNEAIHATAKKKLTGQEKIDFEADENKLKTAQAKYDEKLLPYQRAGDEAFSRVMRFGDMANQSVMSIGSLLKGLNEMSKISSMEDEKLAEQSRLLHQTMRSCTERLIQSLTENTKEANDLFTQVMEKLAQVMSLISWKN